MIFKTDPSEFQSLLEDTSAMRGGYADGAYFAESYDDVCEVLRRCHQTRTRVTISGNGTGTTGGRIPFGGVALAMPKLNRILNVKKNPDGTGVATVQAATLLFDLQQTVEAEGLFYPPDPTERLCFIGATIANNSSGARTFKYGPTRNYVGRLKLALPSGDLLEVRRGEIFADDSGVLAFETQSGARYEVPVPTYRMPNVSKHVAGYYAAPKMDLIDLFIGSEGTLGVVLEADLKLLPKPERIFGGLAYFADEARLLAFVDEARARSRDATSPSDLSARAIEFFDKRSLDFLRPKYPQIPSDAVGAIFFEQEITSETEDALLQAWLSLMESRGALIERSWIALTPAEQQDLRAFRHALPASVNEWYAKFKQRKISTDMAVPHHRFPELMRSYQTKCEAEGFDYVLFGHIGDAHLHLNILPKNDAEARRARELYRVFVREAIAMGGTISAEHGVGKLKAELLVEMFGEDGIRQMTRVKKSLDPNLILNVGNLIPEAYLAD
ncbi:MAG: FAD-binding oxidoreductase [Chloroherpetonaceae bacterium]|nr:FAD-binding oxidoreductase [Chloroherpetonaceae bacterium]MDW8436561.1 FAD-binding oxidoreductase [Chloroherpetonaceae bacterium]